MKKKYPFHHEIFDGGETKTPKHSFEQLIFSVQNKTDNILQLSLYDDSEISKHPLHFVLVNIALQTSLILKKIVNINSNMNLVFIKAKAIHEYVIVLLQEIHKKNSIEDFSSYLDFLEKLSDFLYGLEHTSTLLHTQDPKKIAPIIIALMHYENELYDKIHLYFSQPDSEVFH